MNVRNIITNRKQFNDYLLNIISAHCFTDHFPTTTYVHTVANTSFFCFLVTRDVDVSFLWSFVPFFSISKVRMQKQLAFVFKKSMQMSKNNAKLEL